MSLSQTDTPNEEFRRTCLSSRILTRSEQRIPAKSHFEFAIGASRDRREPATRQREIPKRGSRAQWTIASRWFRLHGEFRRLQR